MPPQHTDLKTVLEFVTRRIEDEALRSGEPLTAEEHFMLHHLPTVSGAYSSGLFGFAPTGAINIVVRDLVYERLCAVAKAAYNADLRSDPSSAYRWEFAAAVSKLNHHPAVWLLQWAGVKVSRQWWDRWALFATALAFISIVLWLLFLAAMEPTSPARWIIAGSGIIGMLVGLYIVSHRMEAWQLKQTIERCRRCSTVGTAW